MFAENPIKRRKSRQIMVGDVAVGGDAPITIQSMTNTDTCDVPATVAQIQRIVDAGADIVRVSVPTMDAADAFGLIRQQVTVPLVADITRINTQTINTEIGNLKGNFVIEMYIGN